MLYAAVYLFVIYLALSCVVGVIVGVRATYK